MALIHDIGEGIVGDFTPHCKIKYKLIYLVLNKNIKSNLKQSIRF